MERIIIIDDMNCKKGLQEFLEANKEHIRYSTTIDNLKNTTKFFIDELTGNYESENKLAVNTDKQINIIHTHEIIYLEASGKKTKLHLSNNKCVEAINSIDSYGKKLISANFIRVHEQYIVNLEYFSKFNFKNKLELELHNGITIPVDTNKKDLLINYIENISDKI